MESWVIGLQHTALQVILSPNCPCHNFHIIIIIIIIMVHSSDSLLCCVCVCRVAEETSIHIHAGFTIQREASFTIQSIGREMQT